MYKGINIQLQIRKLNTCLVSENENYLVKAGTSEHMKKVCNHLLGLFLPSMKPVMNPGLKLIHLVLQLVSLSLYEGQVQLLSEKIKSFL